MTSLTHGIINTEVLFHVLDSVCFPYGQQHMNEKKNSTEIIYTKHDDDDVEKKID